MSHFPEESRAEKVFRSVGWLCAQSGYSRKHLNRLADNGEIPGSQPRTSRSHWRFEDGPNLRRFVRGLRSKAKQSTATPKPVRRYVRETIPTPLKPPRNEFAGAVRQLKGARDAYILDLARLMERERARIGAVFMNKTLREEGVSSSDVERARALLDLSVEARQVARALTDEHAIAVKRAKQLSPAARTRWLQKAKKHGLTAYELQASIGEGRVVTVKDIHERSGYNSGILTIEGIVSHLEIWSKRGKRGGRLKGFGQEQKQKLSEELRRLKRCIADIEAETQLISRAATGSHS